MRGGELPRPRACFAFAGRAREPHEHRAAARAEGLERAARRTQRAGETRHIVEHARAHGEREEPKSQLHGEKLYAGAEARVAKTGMARRQDREVGNVAVAEPARHGRIAEAMQRVASIRKETRALLQEWKQDPEDFEESATESPESKDQVPLRNMQQCIRRAEKLLTQLKALTVPRFLKGRRLFFFFVVLWLLWPSARPADETVGNRSVG